MIVHGTDYCRDKDRERTTIILHGQEDESLLMRLMLTSLMRSSLLYRDRAGVIETALMWSPCPVWLYPKVRNLVGKLKQSNTVITVSSHHSPSVSTIHHTIQTSCSIHTNHTYSSYIICTSSLYHLYTCYITKSYYDITESSILSHPLQSQCIVWWRFCYSISWWHLNGNNHWTTIT